MKQFNYKFGIAGMIFLLISGFALFAMERHQKANKKLTQTTLPGAAKEEGPGFDSVLLKRFTSAIRSLDFNRPICTYAGLINMDDPNDTTNSVHHIKFLFCRSGGGYYYRLGDVEIVHQGNLNVYIQHDQHKVVVSGQQIVIQPPVKNLGIIMKSLSSENYELKVKSEGTKQTLSLINEQHLSCKELSVTLDTLTGKLVRIHSRLNDFGSPMDKGKDKVMDVTIRELSSHANRGQYPLVSDIVKMSSGKWVLTGKYSTYELIML